MVMQRAPAILGKRRDRPVDRYRDVLERFSASDLDAVERLANREAVVDALTEHLRPVLDAIVEADATTERVGRLERTIREKPDSALAVVARAELVGARDRWHLATGRLRELLKDEETLLRYLVLRHLVRGDRR
jgi:hypothetical protein